VRWIATFALALSLLLVSPARAAPDYKSFVRAFVCIHSYEGAWNANTGNGYYGGLQMDWSFMRAYGPEYLRAWGPASNWPPSIQIAVAIRAHLSGRGFYPWPNTARRCGLI
jgi:hypothetical protein